MMDATTGNDPRPLRFGTLEASSAPTGLWRILIADDEKQVHIVTKMVLRDMQFEGRGMEFMSAYGAAEACAMLDANPDIAVILLDVVMESDKSGFEVIHHIRETSKNKSLRIILRTGQPGYAPERKVIADYDINDYKEKTELTSEKLFTSVMTALRSYRDIVTITRSKHGLESIISASYPLFKAGKSVDRFASAVLEQVDALLQAEDSMLFVRNSGIAAVHVGNRFEIVSGTSEFSDLAQRSMDEVTDPRVLARIKEAMETKSSLYLDQEYVGYLESKTGYETVLYLRAAHPLEELDKDLLHIFSTNMALAFDNVILNQDIVDTQKEILFTIGDVVETRSKETAHHIKRVVEYSRLVAKAAGLDDDDMDLLANASPMHDIGKIGIPDGILNKPGPLSADEFEIMKGHAAIGYEILRKSQRPILKTGAMIALQHHERWDGTGYPARLAGEDIHLFARITSIVDVFDALCQKRVYKSPWEPSDAKDFIDSSRGTGFEPRLVEAFDAVFDEVLDVRERFPD